MQFSKPRPIKSDIQKLYAAAETQALGLTLLLESAQLPCAQELIQPHDRVA
jgi:hypothetical protein